MLTSAAGLTQQAAATAKEMWGSSHGLTELARTPQDLVGKFELVGEDVPVKASL